MNDEPGQLFFIPPPHFKFKNVKPSTELEFVTPHPEAAPLYPIFHFRERVQPLNINEADLAHVFKIVNEMIYNVDWDDGLPTVRPVRNVTPKPKLLGE